MRPRCQIYKCANFLGKRWTLLILLELYKGKEKNKRYSEIKKRLPKITPKILSSRLNELVQEGLISKSIDTKKIPITSNYALTKKGLDFIKVINEIKSWSLKYNPDKTCKNQECESCIF